MHPVECRKPDTLVFELNLAELVVSMWNSLMHCKMKWSHCFILGCILHIVKEAQRVGLWSSNIAELNVYWLYSVTVCNFLWMILKIWTLVYCGHFTRSEGCPDLTVFTAFRKDFYMTGKSKTHKLIACADRFGIPDPRFVKRMLQVNPVDHITTKVNT